MPFVGYWTARSCFSAAVRVENAPRLRRWPVFGFFLREYSRYLPDAGLRIMALAPLEVSLQNNPSYGEKFRSPSN